MNNFILSLAFTTHLGFQGTPELLHPHIRYEQDDNITGLFLNSEGTVSAYHGIKQTWGKNSVELAVVTGYKAESILPYVRFVHDMGDNTTFFVTPAVELFTTNAGVHENIGIVFGIELTK